MGEDKLQRSRDQAKERARRYRDRLRNKGTRQRCIQVSDHDWPTVKTYIEQVKTGTATEASSAPRDGPGPTTTGTTPADVAYRFQVLLVDLAQHRDLCELDSDEWYAASHAADAVETAYNAFMQAAGDDGRSRPETAMSTTRTFRITSTETNQWVTIEAANPTAAKRACAQRFGGGFREATLKVTDDTGNAWTKSNGGRDSRWTQES
jgi:hypothetical protein